MKKFLSLLLCLSLVLSLGVLSVLALENPSADSEFAEAIPEEAPLIQDGEDPDDFADIDTPTDAYDESGNLITTGTISSTQITWRFEDGVLTVEGTGAIPDFAYGNEENHVPWYIWTEKIKKLVVGDGITRVGAHMVEDCFGLREIDLPEGLTEIGTAAFSGCAGLRSVLLPSTLEIIGSSAFSGCSAFDGGLGNINFPDGLKSIGANAFSHDPLSAVVLPQGLEFIGDDAFLGAAIRELTIPGGVTLERQAFGGCKSLASVVVEQGATELPEHCFDGCSQLSDLRLPDSIEVVGSYAVYGTALTALTLPSDDEYEFAGWFDKDGNVYTPEDVMQNDGYTVTLYPSWLYAWIEGRFTDVSATIWYHDAVQFCYQTGIMNGMAETTFGPNGTATRAQVVTVLWRIEGQPEVDSSSSFSDVSAGTYYSKAVAWAAANNITNGYTDGTFRPNNAVTRQEFLTFLYRYTQYWAEPNEDYEGDPVSDFSDKASIASWALPAERWSVACGLQSGVQNSDGTYSLNPTQSIKRSELATFLARYCASLSQS